MLYTYIYIYSIYVYINIYIYVYILCLMRLGSNSNTHKAKLRKRLHYENFMESGDCPHSGSPIRLLKFWNLVFHCKWIKIIRDVFNKVLKTVLWLGDKHNDRQLYLYRYSHGKPENWHTVSSIMTWNFGESCGNDCENIRSCSTKFPRAADMMPGIWEPLAWIFTVYQLFNY